MEEDINKLNAISQKKEQVITTVDEINAIIFKCERVIGYESLSSYESYRDLIERINDQLRQTKAIDDEVRKNLELQAQKMAKSMEELRLGRQTVKSYYQKNTQVQGYFIDKKK